jgi:hypothetical protein
MGEQQKIDWECGGVCHPLLLSLAGESGMWGAVARSPATNIGSPESLGSMPAVGAASLRSMPSPRPAECRRLAVPRRRRSWAASPRHHLCRQSIIYDVRDINRAVNSQRSTPPERHRMGWSAHPNCDRRPGLSLTRVNDPCGKDAWTPPALRLYAGGRTRSRPSRRRSS